MLHQKRIEDAGTTGQGFYQHIVRGLRSGQTLEARLSLRSSFGWYDISIEADTDRDFLRRLAGHIENGKDSASDPAFGSSVPKSDPVNA